MPVWTSSTIIRISFCIQYSFNCFTNKGSAGSTPDSPWMISIITAAVLYEVNDLNELKSLKIANLNPGTTGPNWSVIFFCPVADIAPYVLPWKDFLKAIISDLPVALRASLIAASFASVPLLQKKAK